MLKKVFAALFITFIMNLPVMAIEPPEGVTIPYKEINQAYTPFEFNEVLEAFALMLSPETAQTVPPSFATVNGDTITFSNLSMTYLPSTYHSILTAYGLTLTPEGVSSKQGSMNYYAKLIDGSVVFTDNAFYAYKPPEWEIILGAYSKVMAPAVVLQDPAPKPGDSDGDGVTDDKDACPGTPKGVKVDERGCWSYPATMLFDFDKAAIKPEYHSRLDEAKKVFDAHPSMTVEIVGYTCDMGSPEYNMGLSKRRASSVRDYLINQVGVDPSRVKTDGRGESNSAYPNDSDANRQKNRRVEFVPAM